MTAAFLFDVDGTLIDSVDLHAKAWQEALAHFGFHVRYDEVRGQIGKGGDHLMPVFVPQDQLDRIGEQLEKYRGELFKRKYLPEVKPFPGVRDLFLRTKDDGYRVALASSAKGDELESYKRLMNISDLVDAETSSSEVESSKPSPDVFEAVMDRVKVEPDAALVVGDTPYDAIAAGRAGLRTVGVLCGGFPEHDLRQAGCIAIYRDPVDLLGRFDELARLLMRAPQTP
ncbi:MAG TPA: HAD family hydrolase [Vicinamibacterales bacterium]|nr:HAD family hydrolase [Vicinamibacterales bacterium]